MNTKRANRHPYLSDEGIRQMDARIEAEIEAFEVLDLIVAEFNSDPMSVQCFDLRTVERAKEVVKQLKKSNPFM